MVRFCMALRDVSELTGKIVGPVPLKPPKVVHEEFAKPVKPGKLFLDHNANED